MPATLKDTGKTEEVVNAIEKNEGEASLLHNLFGLTEEKNSKDELALNLDRTARGSKPISGIGPTALAATKDTEYEEGQHPKEREAARHDPICLENVDATPPVLRGSPKEGPPISVDLIKLIRDSALILVVIMQILDDTHHCILRSLYDCAQRYGYGKLFCALSWYKAGHAELQEFHIVLRSVHINEAHLNIFQSSVKELKEMLCRIAQIRHCTVHHQVNAPVLIIKEMVYDCIELTIMLRDRKATELMETTWDDTLEEISYN
ncbi:hypothetical protein BPAE_0028g00580 [Botrytis paeoniae]|uniref:Uncharacterized protein n=1 Tax=Botrytis paeoniae TaxID=278948 RepID=A0A4Z1FZV6_9HELO|nr:hypothetical protein BPAE_0028g00580 [Botrytis paeoniae]